MPLKRYFDVYCHDTNTNQHIQFENITSTKPKQSAGKALTRIINFIISAGVDPTNIIFPIKFELKETTEGSKGKTYFYSGTRTELTEPIKLTIKDVNGNDKIVTYKYSSIVKNISHDEYFNIPFDPNNYCNDDDE